MQYTHEEPQATMVAGEDETSASRTVEALGLPTGNAPAPLLSALFAAAALAACGGGGGDTDTGATPAPSP
ncbi:MAG: DUF1800 domain-containing protein, partial [Acidovorax sp.]